MKTNSTFKMFRNLLLLVVGVLGFAVSGVGQTYNLNKLQNVKSVTLLDDCSNQNTVIFEIATDWNEHRFSISNGVTDFDATWNAGSGVTKDDHWVNGVNLGKCFKFGDPYNGSAFVILNIAEKTVDVQSVPPLCVMDFSKPIQFNGGWNYNDLGGNFVSCGAIYYSSMSCANNSGGWFYIKQDLGNNNYLDLTDYFVTGSGGLVKNGAGQPWGFNSYSSTPYYIKLDFENKTIEATTSVPNCGPKITSATVSVDGTCAGQSTLTAGRSGLASPADGYPKCQWFNGSTPVTEILAYDDNDEYEPSVEGNYKVRVYASSTVYADSDPVTISGSPTISVSPSTLSFARELGQTNLTANVTISTACVDLEDVTFNCADANYTVTDNHNGTYTITFKSEDLDDEGDIGNYNTTVLFDDGVGGAEPCELTLSGVIASCIGQDVANFDFSTNTIGSTVNGVSLATSFSSTDQQYGGNDNTGKYYYISNSIWFANRQFALDGNTGDCFQIYSKTAFTNAEALSLSGIPTTGVYAVQFTIGNSGNYTGEDQICTTDVLFNGSSIGSVPYRGTTTLNGIITGGSTATIALTTSTAHPENSNVFFIDNVSIKKVCPPEIEITSVSSECESSASFTATATAGTGTIASYTWYVNGDVEATHTSSSTTDTFEPGRTLSNNSIVRVVVTDEYGVTAEATYTTNCGPDINDIPTQPARICQGGNLSMTVPTVTPKGSTTITSQGWEVADSPTSNDWTPLASLNGLSASYNNKYIRYYAIDNTDKKGKSNAVQITMFKVPEVGAISIDDICVGGTFVLPSTGSTVYADADDDGDTESTTIWQYSTASNFSSVNTLTDATQFNSNGTYYIRYGVTDECNITTYSETSADVNVKTITPSYETYLRVSGSSDVVVATSTTTSTCINDLTYSITSGNGSGYFSINSSTGEIKLESSSASEGNYPLVVRVSDASDLTRYQDINVTISLTADPTLTVDGCFPSDVYLYTNQPYTNTFTVSSGHVNGDIELSLAGSAATAFTLSQTSVTKNTVQDVTATLATPFTSAGSRTLTFTAHDSYGSSEVADVECSTTINVVDLSIRDYVDAQTRCN
ncbi:MAG: cadherin repeat domain-containing protein, partial [Bacteroidales bacterium]|nr:cadherin repeat domain-containing protein [Bacteroidales bacterium]